MIEAQFEQRVQKAAIAVVCTAVALTLAAVIIVPLRAPKAKAHELANIAVNHARNGDYERAEHLLRLAIQQDNGNAGMHFNLGMVLLGLNRDADACAELYEALRRDSGNPEYNVEYGRCLVQLGDLQNAGAALLRGIDLGFCDRKRIEDDTLYDPLRREPVYRQIMDALTARCIPK